VVRERTILVGILKTEITTRNKGLVKKVKGLKVTPWG